ncbi:MAG: tetratricopeptide repeat protein [Bacteroidia bacterium]|nr:tetratricopeptide repeat protein [Bacteroidia bacterium]
MRQLFLLCLIPLIGSYSLPAQQFFTGTYSRPAQKYYDQGISHMESATWGKAIDSFNQAVDADSSYIDALLAHGISCRQLYQNTQALKSFNKVISLYPRSLVAHEQLALLYQEMGRLEDAVNVYKQLLTHHPAYAEGYVGLAKTYFSLGEDRSNTSSTEAIHAYIACVKASDMAMRLFLRTENNKRAADVRLLAGRAYMEAGDFNSALKYIKACKRQLEEKPYFHYYLGLCYFRKGDKEKAKSNFDVAREMGYKIPSYMEDRLQNWR